MSIKAYLKMSIFDWAFILVGGLALSILTLEGCGAPKTKKIVERAPSPPAKTCESEPVGSTRKLACGDGFTGNILEVCSAEGSWTEADRSCVAVVDECEKVSENKVTWEKDILPIINERCLTCHITPERYDDYEVVKKRMNDGSLLERINKTDERRMPKPPLEPFDAAEKKLFQRWDDEGLLKSTECADKDPSGNEFIHLNLDYIEEKILDDLNRLDSRERKNARYLVLSHKYNTKPAAEDMLMFQKSVYKGANTLSTEEFISLATAIDVRESIFRIDLEDFGLETVRRVKTKSGKFHILNDWDLVVDKDKFRFESFTTRGLLIKGLTASDAPWLHADNFNNLALTDDTYYDIIGAADNIEEFWTQIGIDLQQKYDDFEVIAAGGFGSPISLNKNRSITRVECDRSLLCKDGAFVWITYDPVDIDGVPERNLFEFPFAVEAGSERVFDFAASEILWLMPNGMLAGILFNAAGERQTFAPLNIVQHVSGVGGETPLDPQIDNFLDCMDCHGKGVLPMNDQIRNHVLASAAEFPRLDVDKAKAYFLPQTALTASFALDNKNYNNNLKRIGVDNKTNDPVNFLVARHRRDWNLEDFCGFISTLSIDSLETEECKREINGSAVVRSQLGQLANGGTASLNQIIEAFPDITVEFNLGKEDIDD